MCIYIYIYVGSTTVLVRRTKRQGGTVGFGKGTLG
jgi:hypothetical protein